MAVTAEAAICNVALLRIGQRQGITSLDPAVDGSEQAAVCATSYPAVRDALLMEYSWGFATRVAVLVPDAALYAGGSTTLPGWDHGYTDPADLFEPQYLFTGRRPGGSLWPLESWRAWAVQPRVRDAPFEHAAGHIFTDWTDAAAPWDATVTYPKNQVVTAGGSSYRSLQAGNLNHLTSDGAWWAVTTDGSSALLVYTADQSTVDAATFPRLFVEALRWALAQELALSLATQPELAAKLEPKVEQALAKALAAEANGREQDPTPVSRYIAARR